MNYGRRQGQGRRASFGLLLLTVTYLTNPIGIRLVVPISTTLSNMIPPTTSTARHLLRRRLSLSSSSSTPSASSSTRSLSTTSRLLVRQPDEWTYPSKLGDNKPRRPFLNPDVTDQIPNVVAIRNGSVHLLPWQSYMARVWI